MDDTIAKITDSKSELPTPDVMQVSLPNEKSELTYPLSYEAQRAIDEYLGGRITNSIAIGGIYFTEDTTDPAITLGYGSWVAYAQGQVLVGLSPGDPDFGSVGASGGEREHVLSVAEMPSHTHTANNNTSPGGGIGSWGGGAGNTAITTSGSAGLDDGHNNLQPFITVCIWKRVS